MTDAPRWRGAPTPDDERRAAAFEARVARLDAASWGRLDAIGAAIAGGSPTARWRRARLDADFFSLTRLLPAALARSLAFTGGALFDAVVEAGALWYRVAGGPPSDEDCREAARVPPLEHASPAEAERHARVSRHFAALRAAMDAQPGRRAVPAHGWDAGRCLGYAHSALLLRSSLDDGCFRRVYDLVEPVIPLASLDEGPTTRALPPAPRAGG